MNLRPPFFFFLAFFCFPFLSQAQLEASIWYFGNKAGLDFRSGTPVALLDGQLDTDEGCASISDAAGNLLFYTDGIKVWNRNHEIMPNGTGLYGFRSSTQSAIIVPNPGDPNIYYIFTCQISLGINYSVVDMSMDGGLGDIVAKNVPLVAKSTEKLTAVKHANGTDIWVIGHGWRNARYLAYQVTSSGVNSSAVTSDVGIDLSVGRSSDDAIGYLKASPDGTKLGVCHRNLGAELLSFDNATGIVDNPIPLSDKDNYGLEFSPSGQVLYITVVFGGILQYDLRSPDIQASAVDISGSIWGSGGLQLGIDGKIYSTVYDRNSLSVINDPDIVGPGCNYEFGKIDLGDNVAYLGLPPFIQSYFYIAGIQADKLCFGETTEFTINSSEPVLSIAWDFGDGNTSMDEDPTHTYAAPGTYTVNATVTTASGTQTETRDILILEVPMANAVNDIEVCHTDTTYGLDLATLDAQVLGTQSPSEFSIRYFATQQDANGNIDSLDPVTVFNEGTTTIFARISNTLNPSCYDTTRFDVTVKQAPQLFVPTDWIVCDDDGDGTYLFDLGIKDSEILNAQDESVFNVSYYRSQTDADNGTNSINMDYSVSVPSETIFYRIENTIHTNCYETGDFTIGVIDQVVANPLSDLEICDPDNDGVAEFDLTEVEPEVLGAQSASGVTITYHASQDDADSNSNPLPTVYTSSSYQQTIFVRVSNALDGSCYATTSYQLNIFDTPVIPEVSNWWVCDDDNDGRHWFDLEEKADEISEGASGVAVTFYPTEEDAQLAQNPILDNYQNTANPQTVYFRTSNSNNSNCFSVGSFQLQVFDVPTAYRPTDIVACDDAETGSYPFDLSTKDGEVLNGQDPLIYQVGYYASEGDALNSNNPLSKEAYTNGTLQETVYARVQHSQLTDCYDITSFNIIINELPRPDLEEIYVICPDSPDLVVDGGVFETYTWSTEEGNVIGNQQFLEVTELGTYELTVTETKNGITCSNTLVFEVVSSGAPDSFTVSMDGFSDQITLNIEAMGIGEFEYSIDGYNYQSTDQFQVFPGRYTLYVRDLYGCRTLTKAIVAIGYQKFFTPNGDGINDHWNIIGGESSTNSLLYIYDRYGKLLRQLSTTEQGWDGTFLGKSMPSADYWFRYEGENGMVQTGHFSLKR